MYNKTETEAYLNGPTLINPFRRVFNDGGTLRLATSAELEHGVTSRTILPDTHASITAIQRTGVYYFTANGAISQGATVYRANDGKVAAAGTSSIGRANNSCNANGESIQVAVLMEGGIAGPPGASRKDGADGLTFAPALAIDFSADNFDRKDVSAANDDFSPTFTATATTRYTLKFLQGTGADNNHMITWPANVIGDPPQPNVGDNAVTFYDFDFDGTDFFYKVT